MKYEVIPLKEFFPALGENGRNPFVTAYLPDNLTEIGRDDEKHPCLIICPGGGYAFCTQRESEPIALQFLPEGFHVFILNYSVAPHHYPTQLREVAGLLELIHRNADIWHCDTARIAIMGFSAGGHLAAHYATSYNCPAVRDVFPESKPVQASVLCYPVITADPMWAHIGSFRSLTGTEDHTAEEIQELSCDKLVTPSTPPAFLWHTSEDDCVSVVNSLLYAQALAAQKIPFELHIYPYGEHGLSTSDGRVYDKLLPCHNYDNAWLACAKKWLRLMFNNGQGPISQ